MNMSRDNYKYSDPTPFSSSSSPRRKISHQTSQQSSKSSGSERRRRSSIDQQLLESSGKPRRRSISDVKVKHTKRIPKVVEPVSFSNIRSTAGTIDSGSVRSDGSGELHWITNQEFRKVFKAMDKNGDGGISAIELRTIMKKLGQTMTENEARTIVNEADKHGRGVITEEDFIRFMKSKSNDVQAELRIAFESMDVDKSGQLSQKELREGFVKLGITFSDEEFKNVLTVVDTDKNGSISWEEFLAAMK